MFGWAWLLRLVGLAVKFYTWLIKRDQKNYDKGAAEESAAQKEAAEEADKEVKEVFEKGTTEDELLKRLRDGTA